MSVVILIPIIGVFFAGVASVGMKYVAAKYENFLGLFRQYVGMTIFAFIGLWTVSAYEGTAMWPERTRTSVGVLLAVGLIGFMGIRCLFKAFDTIHGAVALVIANAAVFLQYFLNIRLFDASESLPRIQIVLGVVFFIIIAQFLLDNAPPEKRLSLRRAVQNMKNLRKKETRHEFKFNYHMLYPIGTAVCRALFFVGNTYFIKQEILTPVQSMFFTETTIFLITIVCFVVVYKGGVQILKKTSLRGLRPYALIGCANVTGAILRYYGYTLLPANMVNFIMLFSIIVAAIGCRIFLKDTMSKKQVLLMIAAFVVLVLFIFGESVMKILGM